MLVNSFLDVTPTRIRQKTRLREHSSTVLFVQRSADILVIWCGLLIAIQTHGLEWSGQLVVSGIVSVGFFVFFAGMKNLYRSWRTASVPTEILYTIETWIAVFVGMIVASYLWPTSVYPPAVLLTWLIATGALMAVTRIGVRYTLRIARGLGFNTRRLAIAGTGQLAHHVARTIARNQWMGFRAVGLFDPGPPESIKSPFDPSDTPRSLDTVVDLARNGEVDTVLIALPPSQWTHRIDDLIQALSDTTASVYILKDRRRGRLPWQSGQETPSSNLLPESLERDALHRCWMEIGGIPAISVYETPFLGPSGWVKRLEDIVISLLALALLALPMLIISIGVKRSSPGPIIFKQRRYGLAGEEIEVWKFRTMTVCEDESEITQARQSDPRVTSFGALLRRTSLDELPQFINALQGRMSVVGPRPHAVSHNEQYRKLVGGYMLRHKVKPGITGLAQINGWRGETDTVDKMAKRIEHDLEYIRSWSLWLDIRIVALTLVNGFVHRNAY